MTEEKINFMGEVDFSQGGSGIGNKPKAGEFVATCVGIAELGTHITTFADSTRENTKIGFDFEYEDDGETYHFPYIINATSSENGRLFKLLAPFFKGSKTIQPPKLIGKTGTLILIEDEFNGSKYAKFDSFKPFPGKIGDMYTKSYKGDVDVDTYTYVLANGKGGAYNIMPAKFRFKVEQCIENGGEGKFVAKNKVEDTSNPTDEEMDKAINIDDIPF